jgi:hypothetical protein
MEFEFSLLTHTSTSDLENEESSVGASSDGLGLDMRAPPPGMNLLEQDRQCSSKPDAMLGISNNQQVRWKKVARSISRSNYIGLLVKHNTAGDIGYIEEGIEGEKKDTRYLVRLYDGRVKRYKASVLTVFGPNPARYAPRGLLVCADIMAVSVMGSSGQRVCLRVTYDNVPGLFERLPGCVTWVFTPDVGAALERGAASQSTCTFHRTPADEHEKSLANSIQEGLLKWLLVHSVPVDDGQSKRKQPEESTAQPGDTSEKRLKHSSKHMQVPKAQRSTQIEGEGGWQAGKTCDLSEVEPQSERLDLPFVAKLIQQTLRQLPKMQNFQVVKNERHDWYFRSGKYCGFQRGFRFKIEEAWTAIKPSAAAYQAPREFGLFCPVLFFQHHFRGPDWQATLKLVCPFCKRQEGVQHNGWTDGARRVFGVSGWWPVLARRYACIGCTEAKQGQKKRTFTALHPDILAQLTASFRHSRDMFIVRHKVCMEKEVVRLVAMLAQRCSFEFMAKAFGSAQYNDFLGQANAYMSHCIDIKEFSTTAVHAEYGAFDDEGGYNGQLLERRVLSDTYLQDHARRYPAMMLYIESLNADMLMVDHTFWCCKHVSVRVPVSHHAHASIIVRPLCCICVYRGEQQATPETSHFRPFGVRATSMASCSVIFLPIARGWMS